MPKTFEIRITKKGKDPRQWFSEVTTRIYPEVQNQIVLSAEITASMMKTILESSGYTLKALRNAINVDILSSTAGVHVGIGRIEGMPLGSNGKPYYEAFNDGFKVTQANIGYFGDNFRAPEKGGYGEKWHHTGKGSGFFYMKPNKVIEPLRFVDMGYDSLKRHIEKQIDKFMKTIEQAGK
jgi:hypothetical protein